MVDAALIQQCADKTLKPAIVEKFIATAGSENPLGITVRAGGRVILVPPPKSPDEAFELVRRYVGQAAVRVGITQYPAGVGVTDASQLTGDLVDACKNIRMGSALFAKVYRTTRSRTPSSRGEPGGSRTSPYSRRLIPGRPPCRRAPTTTFHAHRP